MAESAVGPGGPDNNASGSPSNRLDPSNPETSKSETSKPENSAAPASDQGLGPSDNVPINPTPMATMIPYDPFRPDIETEAAAKRFYDIAKLRRTVRMFSDRPVSRETIEWAIQAASTAPSGAHKQPWRFVAVGNPDTKARIRVAAEAEEREFYERRASERWLDDLRPFGTNPDKPFLETAPWLIIVMALKKTDDGGQVYYLNESVGIAVGMLLTALHRAGLATLTHTPSPMKFLCDVLGRPDHERPFVLIPVGYPAEDCAVPELSRKPLDQISVFIE